MGAACPFCAIEHDRVFLDGPLVRGLWDAFPVSPGHALLVTRRHVASWFDATPAEQAALLDAISAARAEIEARHQPEGYNVGFNAGEVAGQTVFHLHMHVIPRYAGDNPEPRGGIRAVIPGQGPYG